jgi:uncharacterized protein YifN (PemK superfamily)
MPLTFHPNAGDIVICDYSTGFQPPEMVKVRPWWWSRPGGAAARL